MNHTYSFEHVGHSAAPPDLTFSALADAPQWGQWGRPFLRSARFERNGDREPWGVGAVRAMQVGPGITLKEQTTTYTPDSVFGYRMIGAGPTRNYEARVELSPAADGGTDIRWTCSFDPLVPGSGPVARAALSWLIGRFLRNLLHYLAQQTHR